MKINLDVLRMLGIISVTALFLVFLAGCTTQPPPTTPQANNSPITTNPPATTGSELSPTVTITSSPLYANTNQAFKVSWRVDSNPGSTAHTAVHYGPSSVPNPAGPSDYPSASVFQCTQTPCDIPNDFSTELTITEPGTYYYRAHAVIKGGNVWSDEKTITITLATANTSTRVNNTQDQNTQAAGKTYNVDISGYAFSPSSITIAKGDTVIWTNKDSVPHTISSDSGSEIASDTVSSGNTYNHTFTTDGTFAYHCNIHPSMHGKVIVGTVQATMTTGSSSGSGSGAYTS